MHTMRLLRLILLAAAGCALLGLPACLRVSSSGDGDAVIDYDPAHCPGLPCLAGRVIAETDPRLTPAERCALWRQYGLEPSFEWIVPQDGFTYHELDVRPWTPLDYLRAWMANAPLPPRALPELIALLNDDPRVHWACPDALVLEWAADETPAEQPAAPAKQAAAPAKEPAKPGAPPTPERQPAIMPEAQPPYGVTLLDDAYHIFTGSIADWAEHPAWPDPLPDFEYYRLCSPGGTAVDWAEPLKQNAEFMRRCGVVYGTNQAAALEAYRAAGSPPLAPITVCVADTGVQPNHPDLAGRLHPNSIDANYRSFRVAAPADRPAAGTELTSRDSPNAVGLPRPAVQHRPASHGTCVAGVVARCTAGFGAEGDAIRILPASVKSERAYVITGLHVRSPVSSFIKLVACLANNFPTGQLTPDAASPVQNTGDVRVVTTSASISPSDFSGAQWRMVAKLVRKGAGAIAEDLRHNDRVYVFAAGNSHQGEPGLPGEEAFTVAVTATMPYDPGKPWAIDLTHEAASLGAKCVSAPGYGIITSMMYRSPNLAYLPDSEFQKPYASMSTPPREGRWEAQTNWFNATSSATPQVASLAALLYAQDPARDYKTEIRLIEESTGGRMVKADWGEARGLVDFAAALIWATSTPPAPPASTE